MNAKVSVFLICVEAIRYLLSFDLHVPLRIFLTVLLRDDTHMTSMKIVQFSRPPTHPCPSTFKFLHPLDLGRLISNEPPSTNDSQSIKRKHNPRMTIIFYQVLFINNYSHFWYSFCNEPALFAQLENVNDLWNNNRTVHVNNETKTQTKPSHVTFIMTRRSIIRFNPQTM